MLQSEKSTMKINVHYISLVKNFTNKSQDEITLENGAKLSDLLNKIASNYGKPFTQEVYEPGQRDMKATFVAMINGVLMDQLKDVDTALNDGDSIIIMSLMTGG